MNQDDRDKLNRKIAEALGWRFEPRPGWRDHTWDPQGEKCDAPPDFTRDPAAALDAAKVICGWFELWHSPHGGSEGCWMCCHGHREDLKELFYHSRSNDPALALATMCGAVLDAKEAGDGS